MYGYVQDCKKYLTIKTIFLSSILMKLKSSLTTDPNIFHQPTACKSMQNKM